MFTWFEALSSLPNFLPLVTFAGVMILLPTLCAILLRIRLHDSLAALVKQVDALPGSTTTGQRNSPPGIVKRLEHRFQEASIKLDQVNTPALIDGIYSEERFSWLGVRLQCEKVEYFTRTLPNLLLNFGLLGTFLGISLNLLSLNQNLTETQQVNASEATDVIQLLQGPLEGMSIAFLTSLVAVFCSSSLVLVNIFWNTGLLRNKLISSLEDYFDNTLHPQIDNRERLDKSIAQMVTLQRDTLSSIESAVQDRVERYLNQVAQTIAQANLRSTEIADQIHQRYLSSAEVLSTTTQRFEAFLGQMATTLDRYEQITASLNQVDLPQRLAAAASDLARLQGQFGEAVAQLLQAVSVIEAHSGDLRSCSQTLSGMAEQMTPMHHDLVRLLEQGQISQGALGDLGHQITQQVGGFQEQMQGVEKAVHQLQSLEDQIETRSAYLRDIQGELTRLIEVMTMTATERDGAMAQAQARLDKRLEILVSRLDKGGQDLRVLRDEFTRLVLLLSQMRDAEVDPNRTQASLGYMLGWFRPKRGQRSR